MKSAWASLPSLSPPLDGPVLRVATGNGAGAAMGAALISKSTRGAAVGAPQGDRGAFGPRSSRTLDRLRAFHVAARRVFSFASSSSRHPPFLPVNGSRSGLELLKTLTVVFLSPQVIAQRLLLFLLSSLLHDA